MIGIWQNSALCSRNVCCAAVLCTMLYCGASRSPASKPAIFQDRNVDLTHLAKKTDSSASSVGHLGEARISELKFAHLTTNDGLSQGYVVAILQDRRGFMWIATRDGLNRYDGNAFVVFKSNPDDPGSLNSNFIQDLFQDSRGYLWVATNTGVNKFDPATERCIRYIHEPGNSNSLGGASVKSVAEDSRGFLWFATEGSGLDRFDPTAGTFTHYQNDIEGNFVGRLSQVIANDHGEIWLVGERGLLHLNETTGQITHHPVTRDPASAESVFEDNAGTLWLLTDSPVPGLLKYEPTTARFTRIPFDPHRGGVLASTENGGSANGTLVADGQNGLWVPSSQGLFYFDRQTNRFTYRFQHEEANPDSIDSNAIMSVFRDRGGVLWVGTEHAGLNILNFRQEQFTLYTHHLNHPDSLSPGRVKAIYEDPGGVLWVGLFPRDLDKVDRKSGQITHFLPKSGDKKALSVGTNVNSIFKDKAGYLWIGGGGSGLDRFDERTGIFKHYRHNSDDPHSLISDNVYTIYGDRNGRMWVGQVGGVSRYDPATDRFVNYVPMPKDPGSLANTVWVFDQDRSGTLWLGTWGGTLSRFDEGTKTFVNYTPDPRDPHKLNGGGVNTIHEDRTGALWLGTFDGLYRFDRQGGSFTRYTERQGLPTSTIRCILEDANSRLWLSTQKGISRFDPQTKMFRNYDLSDGLQSDEFSTGCYQGSNGEIFFGGSNGFNAFFPESVRDDPYVPPVAITSFKIFNKPVAIGDGSLLKKAIPYVDSLTLPYRDGVFSFEFAALSYANSQKNRYRYELENFEPDWNEVSSKQRLATYTNLDPGSYTFRVHGSNSDGIWNETGASLSIIITPPWWRTNWFRILCALLVLVLVWAIYQLRVRQLRHEFALTLEARVGERTSIARELHDTLLQSFQGLMLRFQIVFELLPERAIEAKQQLEKTMDQAASAITEGRDAVQGLRASVVQTNDLARAINMFGEELATDPRNQGSPAFRVIVEGESRELHPILRDEIFRIAAEALRNAFHHANAGQIEVEIRYDDRQFRLHVRDDGMGIDQAILSDHGRQGHYGLPGIRERAELIGGKLDIWSELGAGTELELRVPAIRAYIKPRRRSWLSELLVRKQYDEVVRRLHDE